MHHILGWLTENFVPAWKAVSILFTGAFGILGLVKNFKHKVRDQETDLMVEKITRWGWISLLGIVLSTVLGMAAQLKESNDNSAAAFKLAQRSDATLQDIERLLTPFSDPRVKITLDTDCKVKEYMFVEFCKDVEKAQDAMSQVIMRDIELAQDKYRIEGDPQNWRHWPQWAADGEFLNVSLSFFKDPEAAKHFWNYRYSRPPKPDLEILVRSYRKEQTTGKLQLQVLDDTAEVVTSNEVTDMSASKSMTSFNDLPGTTLMVTSSNDGLMAFLRPTHITITNRQGVSVDISSVERIQERGEGSIVYPTTYRYIFPKHLAMSQSVNSSAIPAPATPEHSKK
jgi:hypothetical protein